MKTKLYNLVASKSLQSAIENGQVVRTGVFKRDLKQLKVHQLINGEWVTPISIKEFEDIIYTQPIKENILIVEDKPQDLVMFVNLRDTELMEVIRTSNPPLFPMLDRIVQYMLLNKKNSLYFKSEVHSKDTETQEIRRDYNLDKYNSPSAYHTLINDASLSAGDNPPKSLGQDSFEFGVLIQGVEVKVVSWVDEQSRELIIQILPPLKQPGDKVKKLFKSEKGFLILNRDLVRDLTGMLSDGTYKRIAYRDLGAHVDLQGHLTSNFTSDTSLEDMRNRDFDVYIINLERIRDMKEVLSLPANKLCILALPTNSIRKALSYLSLFRKDQGALNHIVDNLLGVVTGGTESLTLDTWSKELIKNEVDLNRTMEKLETDFRLSNEITNEDVDIPKEIEKVLLMAERINASNIDICPGSPIRLYKNKVDYESYSDIRMTPNLVEILLLNMVTPGESQLLYSTGELDTSYSIPGVGRYRLGVVMQRSSLAISIRRVPRDSPTPEQLRLPRLFVEEAVEATTGMTLIVGEPNSGKTVTFNCIIDTANERIGGVLFLMGNPIEFTHQHKKALVIQVEVGKDLPSYSHGMAKSLRMNTSMLGFEELRTKEEFAALGALLNSPNSLVMTAHASSVRKGVENLVDRTVETGVSLPKALEDVANALNFVMYQKLLNYNGNRVLIYEKLKATPEIKNLIRKGNFNQLEHAIASSPECESMDRVILQRLKDGLIDFDTAKPHISDTKLFEMNGYK